MNSYNITGNREEIPVRPAVPLLDEHLWDTEGASLEKRRSQAKLSGKKDPVPELSGKSITDTDGASPERKVEQL